MRVVNPLAVEEIAESVGESIEEVLPIKKGLPDIEDAVSLIESKLEEPPQLIKGVLHRGSKLILGGASKSYKTWSLLDMAISVATGSSFWDFPTVQGRTLFVNFEIQNCFFRNRLQEVCRAKGVNLNRDCFDVWNLRGYAANLSDLIEQILSKTKGRDYSLLVFDPIYKCYGNRDENSAGDVADLLNGLERIAVETNAAIGFAAHFSKGNQSSKESIDRVSGSGTFSRDPDSILVMTKHEQKDSFTVDLVLRNFSPVDSFVVRREHPLMIRDSELDPEDLKKVGGRPSAHKADDLLSLLTKSMKTAEWQKIAEEEGIARATFYRLYRDLKKDKKIFQVAGLWAKL